MTASGSPRLRISAGPKYPRTSVFARISGSVVYEESVGISSPTRHCRQLRLRRKRRYSKDATHMCRANDWRATKEHNPTNRGRRRICVAEAKLLASMTLLHAAQLRAVHNAFAQQRRLASLPIYSIAAWTSAVTNCAVFPICGMTLQAAARVNPRAARGAIFAARSFLPH